MTTFCDDDTQGENTNSLTVTAGDQLTRCFGTKANYSSYLCYFIFLQSENTHHSRCAPLRPDLLLEADSLLCFSGSVRELKKDTLVYTKMSRIITSVSNLLVFPST